MNCYFAGLTVCLFIILRATWMAEKAYGRDEIAKVLQFTAGQLTKKLGKGGEIGLEMAVTTVFAAFCVLSGMNGSRIKCSWSKKDKGQGRDSFAFVCPPQSPAVTVRIIGWFPKLEFSGIYFATRRVGNTIKCFSGFMNILLLLLLEEEPE